mmetsp:Transcript_17266/g.55355  ORF Transcript_17266/g.55355 Transcript_17266/m.55355 type:complete len:145 (+) Transcript_17266:109-543(+)
MLAYLISDVAKVNFCPPLGDFKGACSASLQRMLPNCLAPFRSIPKILQENASTNYLQIRKGEKDIQDRANFSNCAVVGSGNNVKKYSGKDINQHSAVFRLNDAPTKGFEKWVGSFTTVRSMNCEFCTPPKPKPAILITSSRRRF